MQLLEDTFHYPILNLIGRSCLVTLVFSVTFDRGSKSENLGDMKEGLMSSKNFPMKGVLSLVTLFLICLYLKANCIAHIRNILLWDAAHWGLHNNVCLILATICRG